MSVAVNDVDNRNNGITKSKRNIFYLTGKANGRLVIRKNEKSLYI